MGINRERPHVFILPEDDANRQIANGFVLGIGPVPIKILAVARGWINVREIFSSDHVSDMHRYKNRYMILMIDFDTDTDRLQTMQDRIPEDLIDRVFVLGSRPNPEVLRQSLSVSFEKIGERISSDCRNGQQTTWAHETLQHNESELARLRDALCEILFQPGI